jgi:PAS domain S-box-containing protein
MKIAQFFNVPLREDFEIPEGINPSWFRARERIFTTIVRLAAFLGTAGLLFAAPTMRFHLETLLPYVITLALFWTLGLARNVKYDYRAILFFLLIYGMGVIEALNFGFSAECFVFFMGFVVISATLSSRRGAMASLALSLITLGAFNALIGFKVFIPLVVELDGSPLLPSSLESGMVSILVFAGGALGVTSAIVILLENLESSWRAEAQSSALLQQQRDLLEQRVAERSNELKAAEVKYRTLVEQLPVVVYRDAADRMAHIQYISPQIEAMLGYSQSAWELDAELWHKSVHPEDRERAFHTIEETLKNGSSVAEYRLFSIDGRAIWVRDNATLVRDENGQPQFVQGTLEDITARKKTEEELRLSDEKYRIIFENVEDVIYETDYRGFLTFVSPSAERYVGLKSEELAGMHIRDLLVNPADYERLNTTFEALGFIKDYELRMKYKDGQGAVVSFSARPILNERGEPVGVRGIGRDITERKRAEEQIRKLSQAMEQGGDSVIIMDRNGTIEYVNPKFTEVTGYTPEDAIGKSPLALMQRLDEEPDFSRDEWWQTVNAGNIWRGEFLNHRKDGSAIWESASIAPIVIAGQVTNFIEIKQDVTARRQAEEEVRKLSRAVEQSGNSVVITNLNGDIEYVNPQFSKTTGYSSEEALGKNPRILKSGRQNLDFYQKLWAFISAGKTWRGTFHNKRKDGSLYWEMATITPVINPNGKVTHYIAIKEDITRQKEIEDALQQSYQAQSVLNSLLSLSLEDQTLEELLDRALGIILTIPWLPTQPKGGIFLVDGTSNTLALKSQNNLDAPLLTMCARVPFGHCLCGRAAAEGKTQFVNCVDARHDNAYTGMQPHGHYNVPILFRDEVLGVLVLYLEEGRARDPREEAFLEAVTSVLASTIRDKQAQQALSQARDQALDASAFKSQLLSRVSHELRTPLSGVLGYAELLQVNAFGELTEEQHKAASQIANSARYLEYMIQDLLDQSQIDAKTIILYAEPFSPANLLARVETSLSTLARNKGLYIQSEIAPDLPISVIGDENRLQQIVVNLVGNAVKFTREGGITIRLLRPSETHWAIEVRDTGAGIPEEARAFIFDPFRQADNSITRENRGTGLGLSITKQLVDLMGGEIALESEVDQGSVFTVLLPLIPDTGEFQ